MALLVHWLIAKSELIGSFVGWALHVRAGALRFISDPCIWTEKVAKMLHNCEDPPQFKAGLCIRLTQNMLQIFTKLCCHKKTTPGQIIPHICNFLTPAPLHLWKYLPPQEWWWWYNNRYLRNILPLTWKFWHLHRMWCMWQIWQQQV